MTSVPVTPEIAWITDLIGFVQKFDSVIILSLNVGTDSAVLEWIRFVVGSKDSELLGRDGEYLPKFLSLQSRFAVDDLRFFLVNMIVYPLSIFSSSKNSSLCIHVGVYCMHVVCSMYCIYVVVLH